MFSKSLTNMFQNDDPIVKILTENHYNILSMPDSEFKVGDIFMTLNDFEDSATYLGHINDVLVPLHGSLQRYQLDVPKTSQIGNLVNAKSRKISRKIGLKFLINFLSNIGKTKLQTEFESNSNADLIFRFNGAYSEYLEPIKLGERIGSYKINTANTAVNPNGRFFVATAIAKSKSINVASNDNNHESIKADIDTSIVAASAEFEDQYSKSEGYTYFGETPVAFGIRLHELIYGPLYNISGTPADNTTRKLTRGDDSTETTNPLAYEGTFLHDQDNTLSISHKV